ncbi:MAG: GNAT family N-acetyltransferase [Jiangellales bacterium]
MDAPDELTAAVEIDRARRDELARVASLVADTYVDGGFVAPDSPYLAQLLDVTARWHEADLLVARSATGGVVGTVTFCLAASRWANIARPGEAEFRMLAVDPLVQGRGVGRRLVGECLARAAAAGARTTVISTEPEMSVAQRMYEAMGFVRSPDRDWAPRPGIDLLTYRYDMAR